MDKNLQSLGALSIQETPWCKQKKRHGKNVNKQYNQT